MEIVDDLCDDSDDNDMQSVKIVDSHSSPPKKFLPLTYEQWRIAGLKLNLVLNSAHHKVVVDGIGTVLKNPPVIFQKALGNRACLFNSFLILLTGWDTYNAIIQHEICNYVSNPLKYDNIVLSSIMIQKWKRLHIWLQHEAFQYMGYWSRDSCHCTIDWLWCICLHWGKRMGTLLPFHNVWMWCKWQCFLH